MTQHTDTRDLPRLRRPNRVTGLRRRPQTAEHRAGETPNWGRPVIRGRRYADDAR